MEQHKKSITAKFAAASFLTRLASAVVYVVLLIGCLVWGKESYFLFMAAMSLICVGEFARMIKISSRSMIALMYIIHILGFVATSEQYISWFVFQSKLWVLTIPMVFSIFMVELFRATQNAVSELGKVFLSLTYITLPFLMALKIPFLSSQEYSYHIILGVFILIWVSDTFAYLFGISFGRHKLMERISPKKTLEGFIGGFAATIGASVGLFFVFGSDLGMVHWIVVGVIIGIMGTMGDLVESMFKRLSGVKDSSNIMPGHGGALDRLDSFVMSVPFIFTYLYLFT